MSQPPKSGELPPQKGPPPNQGAAQKPPKQAGDQKSSNRRRNRKRPNKNTKPQDKPELSPAAKEAQAVYPEMPAMVADVQATLDKIKAAKQKAKEGNPDAEPVAEKPVKKKPAQPKAAPPKDQQPAKAKEPEKPVAKPAPVAAPDNPAVDRIKALMAQQKTKQPAAPKSIPSEPQDPAARLKELFEQKKREKQQDTTPTSPPKRPDTNQENTSAPRPSPPKPASGDKDEKKESAPDDESPADRLRRLLEERKKEREAERQKEEQEKQAQKSEEEQKVSREAEARANAEAEIREKYRAQREAREKRRQQSQPVSKSKASPPAGPMSSAKPQNDERNVSEALLALEKWWNVLSKTRVGRVIKRIVEFYQKIGAVAVWTVILFIASRYVVKFITGWLNSSDGFDMFSARQWWALGQLYFKYKVPDNIALTMAVVALVWISGGLLFWARGWPWVRPIYLFFLQLMFLPVGLSLFIGFVFLVITRHVWRKLRKA